MPSSRLNRSQFAVGVAVAVALVVVAGLAWGFGQQLALARQMRVEEVRLERAVAAEQGHYDELVARLEYVTSEEYVEHWAREEAKMAKPGEVAIIPVAGTDREDATGAQQPGASTMPESRPLWVELWELVFGAAE